MDGIVSLFGHEGLLCPCLQVPHKCLRLGGGGSGLSLTGCCVGGAGVPGRLPPGLGTSGKGQVISLSPSGQKGRILSWRYHCRSAERPLGDTIEGNSFGSGDQRGVVFIGSISISSVSMLLNVHHSWLGGVTSKVVVLLDASYLSQMGSEEVCPITSRNDCATIFVTHQLSKVALS